VGFGRQHFYLCLWVYNDSVISYIYKKNTQVHQTYTFKQIHLSCCSKAYLCTTTLFCFLPTSSIISDTWMVFFFFFFFFFFIFFYRKKEWVKKGLNEICQQSTTHLQFLGWRSSHIWFWWFKCYEMPNTYMHFVTKNKNIYMHVATRIFQQGETHNIIFFLNCIDGRCCYLIIEVFWTKTMLRLKLIPHKKEKNEYIYWVFR